MGEPTEIYMGGREGRRRDMESKDKFKRTLTSLHVQGSAKRRGCLLSYNQAEPGRELTQPSTRLLAEPCMWGMYV